MNIFLKIIITLISLTLFIFLATAFTKNYNQTHQKITLSAADNRIYQTKVDIKNKEYSKAESTILPLETLPETHQKAALYLLAEIYAGKKEWQKAIEYYQKIINESKNNTEISNLENSLALAFKEQGETALAEIHFISATEKNPQNETAWLNLIKLYQIGDDTIKAQTALENAQSALPTSPELSHLTIN